MQRYEGKTVVIIGDMSVMGLTTVKTLLYEGARYVTPQTPRADKRLSFHPTLSHSRRS